MIQSGSATVQSTKTRHNEDMNLESFRASTTDDKPPSELSTPLEAMWYQGKGDWEEALTHLGDDQEDEEEEEVV